MIYYARFCCRIAIGHTGDDADDDGWDEILAVEPGGADAYARRLAQFAPYRLPGAGAWFSYSPALAAHVTGLRVGHHSTGGDGAGERFVDTAAACAYTGRARQVLYRWASEGRITRYGSSGTALWDVLELPGRGRDGKPGAAPPRR